MNKSGAMMTRSARAQKRQQKALVVPKCRKRSSRYTKSDFLAALANSGGIKSTIAKRLGCVRETITELLHRPDWPDVLALYEDERDRVTDAAERCIVRSFQECSNERIATQNARWYLSKVRRDQFGNAPFPQPNGRRAENQSTPASDFDLAQLNLDIDTRRKILEAMESMQAPKNSSS